MKITIECTNEEFLKVKPLFSGIICNLIVSSKEMSWNKLDSRLNLIKSNIFFPMTKERLYRRLRMKGYSKGRKTLSRDLEILQDENFLKLQIITGGKDGCYTNILAPIILNV